MLATVAPLVPVMATATRRPVYRRSSRFGPSGMSPRLGPRRQIPRCRSGYRDDEGDAVSLVPERADPIVLGEAHRGTLSS